MDIYKLIYLIQKKNDLNRRRHRFYHKWHGRYNSKQGKVVRPTYISVEEAITGYRKAQAEMKTYTKEIREIAKYIGAQIRWNGGGMMSDVKYGDQWINHKGYWRYCEMYLADTIILGGE